MRFARRILSHPVARWSFATAVAIILAGCSQPQTNPVAPVSSGDPTPGVITTCAQAQAKLVTLDCSEAMKGPDVTRKDGTIHIGKSFLEVCLMAQDDGLMLQSRLNCLSLAATQAEAAPCGFCNHAH